VGRTRKNGRLYRKPGRPQWYAYLKDLGGGQEAMIPEGEKFATTDRDVATAVLAARIEELKAEAEGKPAAAKDKGQGATLAEYAAHHLERKARTGKVTEGWLAGAEMRLRRACEFFGAQRPLATISVKDVNAWVDWLAALPSHRNGRETLSGGTVRHHLNDLSNLYRRAQGEEEVPIGYNPVSLMLDKPQAERHEARWLEPHEAALLLEAARLHKPDRAYAAGPLHEIIATMLLTGGRQAEVLGLAVDDISFERRCVTFRPHPWRGLKTRGSHRTVPLWPQLEDVLRAYLAGPDAPKGKLLFPSPNPRALGHDEERMFRDVRRPLDTIAESAGWAPGEVRPHALRHTYTAARLQTLDRGAPVSVYTVARELGHGGTTMVERVYGHLGELRHRSEVVEYRPAIIAKIPDLGVRKTFIHRLRVVRGEAA